MWKDDSSIPLATTERKACLAVHVAGAAGVALNDAPEMLAEYISIPLKL